VDPAGLVTSCARGRRHCRGVSGAHGRRRGASGGRDCRRRFPLVAGLLWYSERRGWVRGDF
jgi:hypothetical protein